MVTRLGIVGAGAAVRELHWPALRQFQQRVHIRAIASRTASRAAALAEQLGSPRVFADYRELLSDPGIDAVLIAVPIESNAEVLVSAVKSGKHVLAEKPIAATPREAQRVLRACSTQTSVVSIAENFRYRTDLRQARQLVNERAIGRVFAFQVAVCFDLDAPKREVWMQAAWRRNPAHPGGFLLDAGIHAVAGLREVLGGVREVFAGTLDVHREIGGPDSLLMQLELASGAVGQLFACYTAKVSQETFFKLTAYGTEGSLCVSDGTVRLCQAGLEETTVFADAAFDKGYRAQWQNFLDCIQGQERCLSSPEEAYADLLVIDAALRSARLKRRVLVAQDPIASRNPTLAKPGSTQE